MRTSVLTTNLRKIGTGLATFPASGYWLVGPCHGQPCEIGLILCTLAPFVQCRNRSYARAWAVRDGLITNPMWSLFPDMNPISGRHNQFTWSARDSVLMHTSMADEPRVYAVLGATNSQDFLPYPAYVSGNLYGLLVE